ncbi:MAG: helix-turn-helix transcriptional regulator [Candidatus Gastranaerophilales bacterium]|nr:helix-turn-helix transcriptional regulator [Candidatus Gastranaerophilales bacterium]
MTTLKIRIKEVARQKRGWSLYRLAKELGLPQQTVYSWANGRTQPSYDNMDRLCESIGCAVGELFEAEPVQQKLNLVVNSD